MRHWILVGLSLAAFAAACGDSRDAAPTAEGGSVNYQAAIEAMPEGQRNGVFIRAIRDAGQNCQHVQASTATGTYRGQPVWDVRCAGGGNWTIVVGETGTASILNANEARLVEKRNTP